eukprot:TRINITY_DN3475_c0_g1_i33.p1 TRINITY_DN3475_c0_g1~~TRINITY_DN3475_c0_g1_i33.p1  ORF type:complete len:136 (-),score=32.87 TRINITY_DN3475_c0_g1_i33:143-550(-)
MDSIKHNKNSKRLATYKGKMIAKWAGDKERINKLVAYQQRTLNTDRIFGHLAVDTVQLSSIFDFYHPNDVRGSSANWKNEYWTPYSTGEARGISRDDKDPVENLDGKFKLSQTCDSPVFGGEVVENELSYDILEL